MNYIEKVTEFHKTFEAPIIDSPQIPSKERCQLRISLLQEELDELKQAIEDKDLVEIADALCDIQYVLSGAILEFGFGNNFDDLFEEVQRSNMSKACSSIQEAIETISHYKKKDGTESMYKQIGNKWIVYRISDNKILKSINYSPANLKKIIEDESKEVYEHSSVDTLVVSAFPGCGKSHLFRNKGDKKILDSDSSTFDKSQFPENYINHIKSNIGEADIILVSSHKEVRDALQSQNINFTLVYPIKDIKDEYIQRYVDRGNDDKFVELLKKNWESWMSELEQQEGCDKIELKKGQYLSDIITQL